ncbi:GtrA family protein [Streptomyces sp. NPDC005955]|uniref:GtrA family protein n=1 Tax=Streptomyces sp. NPDC005955 TaxID=3364738 RepID=UPI0036C7BB3A
MGNAPSGSRRRFGSLSAEIIRFGTVGAFGWIIDVAVFNFCLHVLELQPVRSGVMASAVAICVNYLGNRNWTYRDRSGGRRTREVTLFFVFSFVGTGIQNGVLAVSHYGLDHTSALSDNLAKNVVGLAMASLFRFWAYRTWVFRTPAEAAVRQPEPANSSAPASPASEGEKVAGH